MENRSEQGKIGGIETSQRLFENGQRWGGGREEGRSREIATEGLQEMGWNPN